MDMNWKRIRKKMTQKRFVSLIVLGGICCVFLAGLLGMLFMEGAAKKRVAILYIATGRYLVMWDTFYQSAEQNFLPGYEKHYYIWTDDQEKKFASNVTKIERERKGFPGDTIDRFEMFLGREEELKTFDYLYFFNANAQVVAPVGEEILPNEEQGITVAVHPGYWREVKRDNLTYPYERRPSSTAYIPEGQGTWYVQGAFNGGRSEAFLHMAKVLAAHIKEDQAKGITAIWHDESHLNKYILDKQPLVLPPNYTWADYDHRISKNISKNIKILMRPKADFGGRRYLRGLTDVKSKHSIPSGGYILNREPKQVSIMPSNKGENYFCIPEEPEKCGVFLVKSPLLAEMRWDPPQKAESFAYIKEKDEYDYIPPAALKSVHPAWTDYLTPDSKAPQSRLCRIYAPKACGRFERVSPIEITVFWDEGPMETFIQKEPDNTYFLKEAD